jgi:hypothetical protein
MANAKFRMYVFDALPMSVLAVLYNIFPPSSYLPHMGFRVPKDKATGGVAESDYQLGTHDNPV